MSRAAETLRAAGDRELAEELHGQGLVKRVIAKLAKEEEKGTRGIRRRLLANALRLTPTMAPELHALADACRARLELDIPLELYVYAGAEFNAACDKGLVKADAATVKDME